MTLIHEQAIVDPKAELAEDVQVGPWTYIGPGVEIGAGSVIGPHAVIRGPTRLGKNTRIFQFASVGEDCQDRKYKGEPTRLEMGDNNVIRECSTIHRGTMQDRGVTQIGNNNLFMAYTHVAHDCIIGNDCILSNNGTLAGHCVVGDGVIISGMAGAHQFCRLGSYCMLAMGSMVDKDVPAYVMVRGDYAEARGMNVEGMRRRGYSAETIKILKDAYRVVYRQKNTLEQAIQILDAQQPHIPELALFVESLKTSTRGIIR
ncbi:Acyl-[acyl-carrier-protein]--UDP-N-acetylglucosamine O-acyltransferase [gamma proteobacterium HdN1]|nr:Acyl-[acyl-carrier-protein]--UDP-N-acetylglucosamine O-acyltransferase [gamma proteobacterium HdN1]